jgi:hypothetical protein
MRSIRDLVTSVRADIDEHDQAAAELRTEPSEYVDIRRDDVEALLEIAARHDECASWIRVDPAAVIAVGERRAVRRG